MRYVTEGVCTKEISFEVIEGKLKDVRFKSGCPGNLEAIQILVEDMPVKTAIGKLKGIKCGGKTTSCVDQLAKALESSIQ